MKANYERYETANHAGNFRLPLRRAPVDGAKKMPELPDVIRVEAAGEQRRLPVAVRVRHRLHGKQMLRVVFEDQRRHRSRRGEVAQPANPKGLTMNALRIAVPLDLDSKPRE